MTNADVDIFSDEERAAVVQTFSREFAAWLRPGEALTVRGYVRDEQLSVVCEVANGDRSDVHTFEAGVEVGPPPGVDLVQARVTAVEFLHAVVAEYLEAERWPPPHLDWAPYEYASQPVFLRGSARNELLERMADALLGEDGSSH